MPVAPGPPPTQMPVWPLLGRLPRPGHLRARCRRRPPQGRRRRGVGHADVHRRAPLRRPCQLLPLIRPTLFFPRCPADGPLQPPCPVHVGPSRAAELRLAQSGADVGAGAARMGPGAAHAPAYRRLEAGRVGNPGAARRRGLTGLKTVRPYPLDKPFALHTRAYRACMPAARQS